MVERKSEDAVKRIVSTSMTKVLSIFCSLQFIRSTIELQFASIRTCLSKRSLLADRHVTRYFVRLRNEDSTSGVRWSRDERCSINEITRKPRFCIMCCWTVCDVSTSSQMKPKSLAQSVGSFLTSIPSYGMSS